MNIKSYYISVSNKTILVPSGDEVEIEYKEEKERERTCNEMENKVVFKYL
ncbi:MAG: hypothetical protein N2Z40_00765 [Caldimicrobium sp.]|nr:hypothetical protein [Caldimicrobium sp.]